MLQLSNNDVNGSYFRHYFSQAHFQLASSAKLKLALILVITPTPTHPQENSNLVTCSSSKGSWKYVRT